MNKQDEILTILQEECAEVIQAVSKINRFGKDSVYKGVSNLNHLTEEVGDLMAMISIMIENNIINEYDMKAAMLNKTNKLMKWSKIYERVL